MAYNIVKHRRGTTREWLEVDLVPEDGELVIEECSDGTRKCKIGNGRTSFTKLPYVGEDAQNKLLLEVTELKQEFDNKLIDANADVSDRLADVEQELSKAIDDITTELEAKTTLIDDKFTSSINTLTQQCKEFSAETTAKLELLQEKAKILNDTDISLLNKLYELNAEQSTVTDQLSLDLDEIASRQAATYADVFSEISRLEEMQKAANLALTDSIMAHITKIYTELADLIDDDVAILRKVFDFNANLEASITAVDKTLTENIEILKTDTTEKFAQVESTTANKFTSIEKIISKNKDEVTIELNTLNNKFTPVIASINTITKDLIIQTERINNIVALLVRDAISNQTSENLATTAYSVLNDPNIFTIDDIKTQVIQKLSNICKDKITSGFTIKLSDNKLYNFRLTTEDQINLILLENQLCSNDEIFIYHATDQPCRVFLREDMTNVIKTFRRYLLYHTIYFNSAKQYIKSLSDLEKIKLFTYGDDISDTVDDETLKQILKNGGNIYEG